MLGYFLHIKLSTHQGLFSIMLYFINSLIFIVKFSSLLMVFFLVRVSIYIECLFLCFVFYYCAIDFDIYKTNLIVHLPSPYVSVIDFFFFFCDNYGCSGQFVCTSTNLTRP